MPVHCENVVEELNAKSRFIEINRQTPPKHPRAATPHTYDAGSWQGRNVEVQELRKRASFSVNCGRGHHGRVRVQFTVAFRCSLPIEYREQYVCEQF